MNTNDFNLLGDVASLLRVQPYRITYLITSGQVPEPAMRLGNRRMFTTADIARIAATLGNNPNNERAKDG
jgi:DNA-binding transcriptional MerR regulator